MARKPRRQTAVTSREVAARAGVSPMTVSRALRRPELVAEGTRARVESAARELAYVPDLAAGTLSSRRSGHVAVLLPSLRHDGFVRTVDALSDALRPRGYHLLIGDSYCSPGEQHELLRLVLGRRPEAIVLISGLESDDARKLLERSGVPVIEAWGLPEMPLDTAVGFSQRAVGFALTTSLVERGYRRVGFLAGPAETDPFAEQRRLGHVEALAAHALPTDIRVIGGERPMETEDGAKGIVGLRRHFPDADALVCATDLTALGALGEYRRHGWRVPEDIAVAGHGDFDFAAGLSPSLTSVRVPGRRIGATAAELVLARIAGDEDVPPPEPIDLGFEIIHRESTRRAGGRM